MNKSEQLNELFSALSCFQGEVDNVYKGKKGYGYNYADLDSILKEVRPLLSKNGLSLTQAPVKAESPNSVALKTTLGHSSGQFMSETFELPLQEAKGMNISQSAGSVLTYARRYALTAFLGISQTDDDAASAKHVEHADEQVVKVSEKQILALLQKMKDTDTEVTKVCESLKIDCIESISNFQYAGVDKILNKKLENKRKSSSLEANKLLEG